MFREGPLGLPAVTSDDWEVDLGPYPWGYEGFEMAVFDLIGKKLGVPVHTLLGGAVRESVRVHYWIGQQTPADSAAAVRVAMDRGFKGIKIKCKLEEPNVDRLRAMWEVGGSDFKGTVDPNERFYTLEQTLELAEQLKELGNVEMFEDPIPRNELNWEDLARFRELRQKLPFPPGDHAQRLGEHPPSAAQG